MTRRLIMSDLHFGAPECTLSTPAVAAALRDFVLAHGPVDELILAGDVLEVNLGPLMKAIFGHGHGAWSQPVGLKQWLDFMHAGGCAIDRVVYLPGNHDYIVWNILATDKAVVTELAAGRRPRNLPLIRDVFPTPFIAGVFPQPWRDRVAVVYPDHDFNLAGRLITVTHGHYFDAKQTLFEDLAELVEEHDGDVRAAARELFILTAMYQSFANFGAFHESVRTRFSKVYRTLEALTGPIAKARGDIIGKKALAAIEAYLLYFRGPDLPLPDALIFGHTHRVGRAYTWDFGRGGKPDDRLIETNVEVWNDGSFMSGEDEALAGSFIWTDDQTQDGRLIKLYGVDLENRVRELKPSTKGFQFM